MNIDIKDLTKDQLVDLQSQIEKQLTKNKFLPKGTICECWSDDTGKRLMYSNGTGSFTAYMVSDVKYGYKNYRVVEQGLTFSDEVINSKDFTEDMDKQLCLCWDDGYESRLGCVDYKNKCTRTRNGTAWNYYRVCTTPYELMPQWAKDIIDKLED